MSEQLEAIIVDVGNKPDKSVIWLHGLGADGHDFEAIIPELRLPKNANIRFIFPHAPIRPITINGGMEMRGWYDIGHPDLGQQQDEKGIRESSLMISTMIDEELRQGRKVLLAGFSQGGVISLHSGLRHTQTLEGLLILSSYLALPEHLQAERSDANRNTPIMIMHGTQDPLIPLQLSQHSQKWLTDLGYHTQRKDYPMPHSIHPQQISDISEWLKFILKF